MGGPSCTFGFQSLDQMLRATYRYRGQRGRGEVQPPHNRGSFVARGVSRIAGVRDRPCGMPGWKCPIICEDQGEKLTMTGVFATCRAGRHREVGRVEVSFGVSKLTKIELVCNSTSDLGSPEALIGLVPCQVALASFRRGRGADSKGARTTRHSCRAARTSNAASGVPGRRNRQRLPDTALVQ